MRRAVFLAVLCACSAAAADKSAQEPVEQAGAPARRKAPRQAAPMIEQEIGALDEAAVKQTFGAAKRDISACLEAASKRMGYFFGAVDLLVRIGRAGAGEPSIERSTLGDRAAERCLLDALKKQAWPEPQGGKQGEARQHLEWPARGRAATELAPDQLGASAASARAAIARCGRDLSVTVYVDPDGAPLAAGGSGPDAAIDCALKAVMKRRFASPGSWTGKVTFAR